MRKPAPDIVVGRLPLYLRALGRVLDTSESDHISSKQLSEMLGMSPAQIRKDLSLFGDFGKQGTGYDIAYLIEQLENILKLSNEWPVVVVGAGHIGKAVANYQGFSHQGFRISRLFDADAKKIGQMVGNVEVQDVAELERTVRSDGIKVGIITVPAGFAQETCDRLISAGVQSILCYAPIYLTVPTGVRVRYNDPVVQLQRLTYYLDE